MTHAQYEALMVHLEYIRERVDGIEAAVLGDPEHGTPGLMERVSIIENRMPSRVVEAARNAGSGLLGAFAAILAAFVRSTT